MCSSRPRLPGRLQEQQRHERQRRQAPGQQQRPERPRPVEHHAEQQWRKALKNARRSREQACPQPVAGRRRTGRAAACRGQWSASRCRRHAAARTELPPAGAEHGQQRGADRMQARSPAAPRSSATRAAADVNSARRAPRPGPDRPERAGQRPPPPASRRALPGGAADAPPGPSRRTTSPPKTKASTIIVPGMPRRRVRRRFRSGRGRRRFRHQQPVERQADQRDAARPRRGRRRASRTCR